MGLSSPFRPGHQRGRATWASAALSLPTSPISFAKIVWVDSPQRDRESAVRPDALLARTATLALGALACVHGFTAFGSEFLVFSAGLVSIGGAGRCLPELRNGVAGTPNKPRMAPLNRLLPM